MYGKVNGLIEMPSIQGLVGLGEFFLLTIIIPPGHLVSSWKLWLINTQLLTSKVNTSPEEIKVFLSPNS